MQTLLIFILIFTAVFTLLGFTGDFMSNVGKLLGANSIFNRLISWSMSVINATLDGIQSITDWWQDLLTTIFG